MPRYSLKINSSVENIIVLDVGTARLGGCFWLRGSQRESEIESWGAHSGNLASTNMYYLPEVRRKLWNGREFLWGDEVETDREMSAGGFDIDRLVEYWKPGLHKKKNDGTNEYCKELERKSRYIFGSNNPMGTKKLAFDFLHATLDYLLNPITGYFVGKLDPFDTTGVSVVMTMPSGWPEHEYAVFQQSADNYNLHSLTMLPESDSMARSWAESGMVGWKNFKVGDIFVTLDWGAGTIDITTSQVVSVPNEHGKKSFGMKHVLQSLILSHSFETSVRRFREQLKTRRFRYYYTMRQDPYDDDTALFFINYFVPMTQTWESVQTHALKIDASKYSSHGNLDESGMANVSIPFAHSSISVEEANESWNEQDQLLQELLEDYIPQAPTLTPKSVFNRNGISTPN